MQEAWGLGRPAGARKSLHLEWGGMGSGVCICRPSPPSQTSFPGSSESPHLTLRARLPLAKAPVGSRMGWPRNVALRVAGSRESVMLSQENSAREYGGYGFPGGLADASDVLVSSNSNSWWAG